MQKWMLCCLGFCAALAAVSQSAGWQDSSTELASAGKSNEGLIYNCWLKGHLPVVVSIT